MEASIHPPSAGPAALSRGTLWLMSIAGGVCVANSLAAFGLMWVWVTIPMLVLGVLIMDVGVQTVQVSEQGIVLALLPEARSRLNTLYMVARFIGGAVGSCAGAYAWSYGRWPAVCAVTLGLNVAAFAIHALARRPQPQALAAPELSAA